MKIYAAALAALPFAFAGEGGTFSYKPDSDKAPSAWASLPVENNACGGSSQSGIDVPTSSCDVTGDYVFSVRIGAPGNASSVLLL